MGSFTMGVASGVVASGLFVLLAKIASRISPPFVRRIFLFRTILPRQLVTNSPVAIAYGCMLKNNAQVGLLKHSDLVAVVRVTQFVERISRRAGYALAPGATLTPLSHHYSAVVSVSGPKWNPMTGKAIGLLGSPVNFVSQGVLVLNDGHMYATERRNDDSIAACYALIVSGTIRFGAQRQGILVCAGRSTLSTSGAATYLHDILGSKKEVRRLRQKGAASSKRWAVVLRVESDSTDPLTGDDELRVTLERVFSEDDFVDPYRYEFVSSLGTS